MPLDPLPPRLGVSRPGGAQRRQDAERDRTPFVTRRNNRGETREPPKNDTWPVGGGSSRLVVLTEGAQTAYVR